MFPLKDSIPSNRVPVVNYSIIIINILVYMYEKQLGPYLRMFILDYGVVPAKLFLPLSALGLTERIIPFFTSMFIHGGFFHLLFNMYYLFVFGDNVEDEFGHLKFLLLYIFYGIFAAVVQVIMYPNSPIPMIGASGAIAGVMGAYFILFPYAKVKTLVFIFIFITVIDIPAIVFLGIWFFIQFLNGSGASLTGISGGIAWWAHVAGFVAGVISGVVYKMRRG